MTEQPLSERFWGKVTKTETCWTWNASQDQYGYGRFTFDGSNKRANRMAWLLTYGEIPGGMQVLHRCDNAACVNPDHLYLGTHADNMSDMVKRGRSSRGEKRHSAKLNIHQVSAIRSCFADGESQGSLAKRYGIKQPTVSRLVRGLTWKTN